MKYIFSISFTVQKWAKQCSLLFFHSLQTTYNTTHNEFECFKKRFFCSGKKLISISPRISTYDTVYYRILLLLSVVYESMRILEKFHQCCVVLFCLKDNDAGLFSDVSCRSHKKRFHFLSCQYTINKCVLICRKLRCVG